MNGKVGFSYNGTCGNEYSTSRNPFGIVNGVRFNLLSDLGTYCKCRSGRSMIYMSDVIRYCMFHNERINNLVSEVGKLQSMPYDLGRKATIDSKLKIINAYKEKGLFNLVCNHYKYAFINRKTGYVVDAVTFSSFCKFFLSRLYPKYGDSQPRELIELSSEGQVKLKNITSSLGKNILVVGNSNVNEYSHR